MIGDVGKPPTGANHAFCGMSEYIADDPSSIPKNDAYTWNCVVGDVHDTFPHQGGIGYSVSHHTGQVQEFRSPFSSSDG